MDESTKDRAALMILVNSQGNADGTFRRLHSMLMGQASGSDLDATTIFATTNPTRVRSLELAFHGHFDNGVSDDLEGQEPDPKERQGDQEASGGEPKSSNGQDKRRVQPAEAASTSCGESSVTNASSAARSFDPTDALRYFQYMHLPAGPMRDTAEEVYVLARYLIWQVPPGRERTAGMRKLLEAKDCFVRACLDPEND